MPSVRVTRTIAADPTSTALLLAGPSSLDLWPGLERHGGDDAVVLASAPLLGSKDPVDLEIRAQAPRRTPTSYLVRFSASGDISPVSGVLTLGYATSATPTPATAAELLLDLAPERDADDLLDVLTALAGQFLDNLAEVAEVRALAS